MSLGLLLCGLDGLHGLLCLLGGELECRSWGSNNNELSLVGMLDMESRGRWLWSQNRLRLGLGLASELIIDLHLRGHGHVLGLDRGLDNLGSRLVRGHRRTLLREHLVGKTCLIDGLLDGLVRALVFERLLGLARDFGVIFCVHFTDFLSIFTVG